MILDADMEVDIKLLDMRDEAKLRQEIVRLYTEGYVLNGGIIPVHIGRGTFGNHMFRYSATLIKVT